MNLSSAIIYLLVGLAVFITGMNMMSAGIKKSAGKGLKDLFKKIQKKSIVNFSLGIGLTGIIQSSTATSVIVIGFINAGVMSLTQGIAIIMGANVGTTVTGLLVSLSGFEISTYLLLLAFIGVALQFIKNDKVRAIGEAIAGFGILFFGLSTMSSSIKGCDDLMNVFQNLFTQISFPLLLILAGLIFAGLVQSFSATIGVVVVLLNSNAIVFSTAVYLLIGATIGSWFPIFLSSLSGNHESKQASCVTLFVKVLAAILGTAIIWPLESTTGIFSKAFESIFPNSGFAVAMFAFAYNLVLMLIQLPLIKLFIKISNKIVVENENKENNLQFIDDHMLDTPAIALEQVKEEVTNMLVLSKENFVDAFNEITTLDFKKSNIIENKEDKIDSINGGITNFLIALTNKVSARDTKLIGSYFHIINDIERIGDHANNFHESAKKLSDNKLKFSPTALAEFKEMYNVLTQMFDITFKAFEDPNFNPAFLHELENKTDILKVELESKHFERISKKTCKVELSPFYSTFLSELERIADHLVNIGYSFINPTGDEE